MLVLSTTVRLYWRGDLPTSAVQRMHSPIDMSQSNAAEDLEPEPSATHAGSALDAFRPIYDEHVGFVWRTLRRYGVRGAELDDAVQDVFSVVYAKLPQFEQRSSLRTWIFGIARRIARNHRPSPRFEALDATKIDAYIADLSDSDPSQNVERQRQARLLHELLSQLPSEQRDVFILVELEQFSVPEASDALGENTNTLSSRLRGARRALSQALQRHAAHQRWRSQCTANES